MDNQFFQFTENGKDYIFESCINGEGNYIKGNNTILGTIYTENGTRIGTQRISYSIITPLHYTYIKRIFPNFPKTN